MNTPLVPAAQSARGHFDVAIIGGGMVGASLALALADSGRSVLLVEGTAPDAGSQPSFDERTTALGNGSRRIFEALGVWSAISPQAAAIRTIHISDAGRFGFARLRAAEQGVEAFGYVVTNRVIGAALRHRLAGQRGLTLRMPARAEAIHIAADGVRLTVSVGGQPLEEFTATLVVAADGAHSKVRAAAGIAASVADYAQVAITANVATDRPQEAIAYERFTPCGPLALLPLYDGSAGVVWTDRPDRAASILALDEVGFLHALQERFGWRAGRFIRAGQRSSYPLALSRAATTVATRTVLIGNAAQALHPVAGQGFNLGLRDAAMLAEIIANAGPDAGSPGLLQTFSQWRAGDRSGVVRFTDGLVKLFADSRPGIGTLRNLGLLLFDLTAPAKSALSRVSAGFGGRTPRLARGLKLRDPACAGRHESP